MQLHVPICWYKHEKIARVTETLQLVYGMKLRESIHWSTILLRSYKHTRVSRYEINYVHPSMYIRGMVIFKHIATELLHKNKREKSKQLVVLARALLATISCTPAFAFQNLPNGAPLFPDATYSLLTIVPPHCSTTQIAKEKQWTFTRRMKPLLRDNQGFKYKSVQRVRTSAPT